MKDPYSVPKLIQETYDTITALTDGFCQEKLNEEYAEMCRVMTAKLCRKRPSPLASGRANTWAAGIVHAVGTVNFAFDRTQTPHTTVPVPQTILLGWAKAAPPANPRSSAICSKSA